MTRISTRRPNRRDYDGGFAKVLAAATSNPKSASSHCQRNSKERELATKFFQKKSGAAHFADSLISMQQSSLGLKITEYVSFNITSEASYANILSGHHIKCQKFTILASFWKPKGCGQTALPDRSIFIGQKLVENAKIQMRDILSNFQHTLKLFHHFLSFFLSFKKSPSSSSLLKCTIENFGKWVVLVYLEVKRESLPQVNGFATEGWTWCF